MVKMKKIIPLKQVFCKRSYKVLHYISNLYSRFRDINVRIMMELKTKLIVFLFCCFVSYSKSQQIQPSTCITPTHEIGRCVSIFACPPILNIINSNTVTTDVRLQLQNYYCGKDGMVTKVCCPTLSASNNETLLPTDDCGQSGGINKITNGDKADLFEFPWQVALKYRSKKAIPYNCGGSLINKRYVLTGAHCITNNLIGVRLGELDFSTPVDCVRERIDSTCAPPPQDFDVTKADATIHPNFQIATLGFDIALIRLPRDAVYNNAVKPICLPITENLTPKSLSNLVVAGWGRTDYGQPSSVLLKAVVKYEETDACMGEVPVKILDSQFCTKVREGVDNCNGDFGGPIITTVNDNGDVKYVQVGLISYGPARCGQFYPDIYTRLSSYTKWIVDNVKP